MRSRQAKRNVQIIGDFETTSYSIKANGKAFRILIDSLYSNKPLAIVRELWSNAFDSHVLAGRKDQPFECHLPNRMEPWFSVRDFGVSMTHEEIKHRFTVVFESSKDKDDVAVGKFGLGCKTPFSMSDTFSIIAYKDGKERSYNSYLDQEDIPTIAYIGESDTSEPDGIEISFPVLEKDFHFFYTAAKTASNGFDVKPVLTGEIIQYPSLGNPIREGTGWKMYTGWERSRVRQGCVIYPIDENALGKLTDIQSMILSTNIIIDFPIGKLEVTPSRESLQYDTRTTFNILREIDRIHEELSDEVNSKIDACESLWEARNMFSDYMNDHRNPEIVKSLVRELTWKGKKLEKFIKTSTNKYKNLRVYSTDNYSVRRRSSIYFPSIKRDVEFVISFGTKTKIYVEDPKHKVSHVGQRIRNHAIENDYNVIWVKGDPSSISFKRLLITLGRPNSDDFIDVSKLDPVKFERVSRNNSKIFRLFHQTTEIEYMSLEDVECSFYVDLEFGTPVYYGNTGRVSVKNLIDFIKEFNKISGQNIDPRTLVGVPKCSQKVVRKETEWKNLFDHVNEYIEKNLDIEQCDKELQFHSFWDSCTYYHKAAITSLVNLREEINGEGLDIHEFLKDIKGMISKNARKNVEIYRFSKSYDFFGFEFFTEVLKNGKTQKQFEKIKNLYPLIESSILNQSRNSFQMSHIIDYINAMNLMRK